MKKISKKYINEILRSQDQTKIFKLCSDLGLFTKYSNKNKIVYNFIRENAPTCKIRTKAYDLAYFHNQNKYSFYETLPNYTGDLFIIHNIVNYIRKNIKMVNSPYQKVAMYGSTNLYFCSPHYAHNDYNKWRACNIKGNEKLCENAVKLMAKYI